MEMKVNPDGRHRWTRGALPGDSKGLPGQGAAGGPLSQGAPTVCLSDGGHRVRRQRAPSGGYKHPGPRVTACGHTEGGEL